MPVRVIPDPTKSKEPWTWWGEDRSPYLSVKGEIFFLLPSPPNTRTPLGGMARMKFKWNQATSLISKKIITLERNCGRDLSLHWVSSDVLLVGACSWASSNLHFLPCSLWNKPVPVDDLITSVSRGWNSHPFSNLSAEAIENQDWRI